MRLDPADLPPELQALAAERQLATLTTLRPDGTPHVVPVGYSWDPDSGIVRIITFAGSMKIRNLQAGSSSNEPEGDKPTTRAVVCQVDGPRWITFEGTATVTDDPDHVAEAVKRYAERYRQPRERDDRVAIEITVDRVLGNAPVTP